MQVLAVDVGTGTQDIYLYDTRLHIENGFKLVVPSPTMIVRRKIQAATKARTPILLRGVTMGGGPSHWAAEDHLRAGLQVYATPDAARSFNDDLDEVRAMGVQIVGADEADRLGEPIAAIELRDFDFEAIHTAFRGFGISLDSLGVLAIAVFDHGAAPPGYSDRRFRFEYLDRRIQQKNRLSAFAFPAEEIPPILTRMQAVRRSAAGVDAPLLLMDTAPAAVLGASLDARIRQRRRVLIANVGNFHTLAFRLGPSGIEGVFEHHTGFMNQHKLDRLLADFAAGTLTNDSVFHDQGHGALVYHPQALTFPDDDFGVVVTGPRRGMMLDSDLRPYFAAPFGDMMLAGCFGMLAAVRDHFPNLRERLDAQLHASAAEGQPPWELEG